MKSAPHTPDKIQRFIVREEALLLDFLRKSFPDRSRTTVKSFLSNRQVAVNDAATTKFDFPLHTGDEVSVNFTKGYKEFRHPRLQIVYEDKYLIVIDKGYGLLSMSTDRVKTNTAYHILNEHVREENSGSHIYILHRLDRDTSGLMMFAKSKSVQEQMQQAWNEMVLDRRYVAVVEGEPTPPKGEISSYLKENAAFHVYSTDDKEGGQYAQTRYEVLASNGQYSLVELQLATGRKNQIRVHLHDIGHSIAGDRKYGATTNPLHRLSLHASRLRFVHPVTRRDMLFESPLPAGFRRVVGQGEKKSKTNDTPKDK
ncbi:MAG: RluA family pseudouridine synthase [Porphyromonadaceae bacterium]|nr:RluA family pseudouridine synthase [Porphyromonadaceae bacterium]